ncbi:MAG: heme a synthase [Gaiellaceae bacterium]|nr:heme a synthase [Gaiellaceae bacterium]
MQVESAERAFPRRRALAVSPATFRRIAIFAATALVLIVATGATVRLTGSGLGCEHWPGCQPGDPFPKKGYHSYVEFSNRIVAFFTVLGTLVLAVSAWLTRGLGRPAKILATLVFVGTLGQAPLGAVTVYYHLNPWLVISHLLLSLAVLGLGVVVLLEATRLVRGEAAALPALARAGGAVILAAISAMVVTGTLATASGPHPGSREGVRRLGNFQTAIEIHVRATAVFGILLLALVTALWRRREHARGLLLATLVLLGLLVVQMSIGEIQYRNRLPWWLVLIHVTAAACVFAWTAGLVARLWRPLEPDRT